MHSLVKSVSGDALAFKEEPQCALACKDLCAALGAESHHGMERPVKRFQSDGPFGMALLHGATDRGAKKSTENPPLAHLAQ